MARRQSNKKWPLEDVSKPSTFPRFQWLSVWWPEQELPHLLHHAGPSGVVQGHPGTLLLLLSGHHRSLLTNSRSPQASAGSISGSQ